MVDLPQHAAQLAIWANLDTSEYHGDLFVLNLRTPYLLAYVIARLFASVFGVMIALKLVVWLAAAGQVLGLHFLCKRLGHDPWLALWGFPLSLGYSFLFGFVSYIAALPLLYVSIGLAVTHAERPSLVRGTLLVMALSAVLLCHGVAFAQSLLFVVPLLMLGKGSVGSRLVPLALPIIAAAVWLMPGPMRAGLGGDLWEPSLIRLLCLPGLLVGSSEADIVADVYGSLLLVMLGLAVGRPARTLGRLLPGLLIVLGLIAGPIIYRGYGPIWPRFAVLLIPATFLAFGPKTMVSRVRQHWQRAAVLAAVTVWPLVFVHRLSKFNRETTDFHQLVDATPRGLRVRPIVFDAESDAFPDLPAFTHLPAYYLVEKGGIQGYSFAMYPSSVVRYRNTFAPQMRSGEEWQPEAFRIEAELQHYDCFMVHSKLNRYQMLFGNSMGAVELRARDGNWSNYCLR
jgi:hypothetical protein